MTTQIRQASSRWRLWFVGTILGLLVTTVCGRLVWLHVFETQHLRDISDEITIRSVSYTHLTLPTIYSV